MAKNVFDTLLERGFIKQTVYEEDLKRLLGAESIRCYVGFDPTADSLHIGHYIPIMAMAHMQRAGHTPIALIGGGTGMVGDPSGRSDMRMMMTAETVQHNCRRFQAQMARFMRFEGENAALMANNADWLLRLNYIDFLREVGTHLSVNKMLTYDCFKSRMEKGLSFFEFNYMPMQAYDFLVLYRKYGCRLQMGGNDQWSNILAGADLIRRKEGADAYAMTFTLLETSDGKKMGKTQKGALWLDGEKTAPYEFFQYFRNVEDVKVAECFKLLTFVELDEIAELTRFRDERINAAKVRLAFEVTKLVHGAAAAEDAKRQAEGAFGGDASDMPSLALTGDMRMPVADLLVAAKAAPSKSEARRLIEGGGVRINDEKVSAVGAAVGDLTDSPVFILHKGKKVHIRVTIKA
ncbi:MAG: tyrosine--tRNA ligase [Clostridiales bacterium]|jgi:tyrosyl-tRNA synthetase|nr:tyrosine--tRNA ligase [Clostridiales bacterium]